MPLPSLKTYRYLAERSGSGYRELFVDGTDLRAQSLVSDMENEGLTPEEVAAAYHLSLESVHEAIEYVHANEDYLANERGRSLETAIVRGCLRPSS